MTTGVHDQGGSPGVPAWGQVRRERARHLPGESVEGLPELPFVAVDPGRGLVRET